MGKTEEKKVKEKKTKVKKAKRSVSAVIIMISVIPLILSILILSAISVYNTKSSLEEEVENRLYVVASNLSSYCNGQDINGGNVSSYADFLDSLKEWLYIFNSLDAL